jgi:hypothetical protein
LTNLLEPCIEEIWCFLLTFDLILNIEKSQKARDLGIFKILVIAFYFWAINSQRRKG